MSAVLTPTVKDLEGERASLLTKVPFDEDELRRRAREHLLTPEEARVLRRLSTIAYLLGE